MEKLEIGKDYAYAFPQPKSKEKFSMIYNGGISWTCTTLKGTLTMDSKMQTEDVLEYVNTPSYSMAPGSKLDQ